MLFPRYIVLLLTTACNLDCVYCYHNKRDSVQSMPMQVAIQAIEMAAWTGLPFHVQLSGGELTLEPGIIEGIASFIKKSGLPVTIGIQTNGTVLDISLIKMLKHYDIQVGVSLDGPPDCHEKLRGKSVSTIRGLKFLSDHNLPFQVTCVVTGQNVAVMDQLALLLGSFPMARGLALDLLVCKGHALKNDCVRHPSPKELKNGLKKLMQALGWINANRSRQIKLRELESLKQAVQKGNQPHFCHASKGEAIAIHPNGTIYPCAQTAGDPSFACGTIDAPKEENFYLLGEYSLQSKQCNDCPVFGFCPGDCPCRLYHNDAQARYLACVIYQTLWKEYVKEF